MRHYISYTHLISQSIKSMYEKEETMAAKMKPEKGDSAPMFTLPDSYKNEKGPGDFIGKWIVLYFYPKDNTSGCTLEAVDFTALKDEFNKLGCEIIGISPDSCSSHEKFIIKHDLGITLLSDTEKKVLEKYGVWQLKKMYGREYHGVVRTTYLIDTAGRVAEVWDRVKVKGHAQEVLETLRTLQESG